MRSPQSPLSLDPDVEALVHENQELRRELHKRKRRVARRRLRRTSALVLPIARAMAHKRASKDGQERPAHSEVAGEHAGVARVAVVALVMGRLIAGARAHPRTGTPTLPSTPAGAT